MLRRVAIAATLFTAACPGPGLPPPGEPAVPPAELAPMGDERPVSGETTLDVVGEPPREPARDQPADADLAALLAAHNRVRAAHCAPPLAWSDALADEAAAWARELVARGCAFEHSSTRHGENLAAGTAGALGPDRVVEMWASEVGKYDFKRPGFSMATGHFTQVVWKRTTALGCGTATCKGLALWVCNYDPAGNVQGEFPTNVAPAGCK